MPLGNRTERTPASQEPADFDRRPISVRTWPIFHAFADVLSRIGVTANAISVVGMLAACAAGAMLATTNGTACTDRWLFAGAAVLIPFRLLCNMLDGIVAINTGTASPTGVVFNEVPDRVSDIAVLLGAGFATHASPLLGAVAAMSAVFVAYVRVLGRSLGLPGDYRGPMAKQQRMFVVTLACAAMAFMPATVLAAMTMPSGQTTRGPIWWALALIIIGCFVTAARRLARIISSVSRPSGQ